VYFKYSSESIDFAVMETEMSWNGDRVTRTMLYILQFANNQAVITNNKEDIKYIRKLMEEYEK
jgi:hypothetical protein